MTRLLARRETGVGLLLLLTVIVVQSVNPRFLGTGNVRDLLIQCAPFAIIACGMTFVIVLGEIDISVGSMVGVLATVLGSLSSPTHFHWPAFACACAVLAGGTLLGLVNGLLVAYGRVPSIIMTLGMLTILRGVNELLLGGNWITDLPSAVRQWGVGRLGPLPWSVLAASAVVALAWLAGDRTPWGRRVYAAGSNPSAAVARGLPVKRLKVSAFALLGFFTGLATLVSIPQLSVVESGIGLGWELFVVTCVVVGGVSISGGRGTILGVVLGVLLLGIVRTVLIFLRIGDQATYWERSIQGAFILAAVLVDRVGQRPSRGGLS